MDELKMSKSDLNMANDLEKYMVEHFDEHYNSNKPVYDIMNEYLNEKWGDFITKETKDKICHYIMMNMVENMMNDDGIKVVWE